VTLLEPEGELPIRTIPGARFACQGSGGCCTGYSFGPLADEDLARLGETQTLVIRNNGGREVGAVRASFTLQSA